MATNAHVTALTTMAASTTRVSAGAVVAFNTELTAAVAEFNLAPDEFADIKRVPGTVTSLRALVEELRKIRTELENPTDETKKSGRLKLYKLFVCSIHALHGYISSAACDYALTPRNFVTAVMNHAVANPPGGLGAGANKLWQVAFGAGQMRTRNCVAFLVHLMRTTAPPAPAPAPGP